MKTKSNKETKINVITLGCSKNLVDSEVLMGQLKASQFDVAHESVKNDADIVIVNTCGFIENAKQESIDTILAYADAKAQGNIEKLYVTGCLSHRYKDELQSEIPEVDAWFGTLELPQILNQFNVDYKQELVGERLLSTPKHYA
ncbi:MAG: 30S ribosomal protein S12 methylthiotransferase RimO, partial [Bacteroidetes bacterium]|nr:30S ribosomal protein S12 methylthiotransferase RimO [Bacteroidota bacterium]